MGYKKSNKDTSGKSAKPGAKSMQKLDLLNEGASVGSKTTDSAKVKKAVTEEKAVKEETVNTKKQEKAARKEAKMAEKLEKEEQKELRKEEKRAAKEAKKAEKAEKKSVPDDNYYDDSDYYERPKKRKGLKIFGVIMLMLITIAAGAYAGVSYYYYDKFIPGTIINSVDCSGKTPSEVEQLIASKVENYEITVLSRNLDPETIQGTDINYMYISNGDIVNRLQNQKPYMWAIGYFKQFPSTVGENVTFDKDLLQEKVNALACMLPVNQTSPADAFLDFRDGDFVIVPEEEGCEPVSAKVMKIIALSVASSSTSVDLDAEGAYKAPKIRQQDEVLSENLDVYRQYCRASVTYEFGDLTEVLDGMVIKDWLTVGPDGNLSMDPTSFHDHIVDYVAHLAKGYDTIGMARTFTASNGREVAVFGEDYGWEIDQQAEIEQLERELSSGAVVSREPHYLRTANSHDNSDVGNTYIEVDMGTQHMYYYREGKLIFDSDFISGLPDGLHDTPEGIYHIFNKESPSTLVGEMIGGVPEYISQVSYWMAFNGGIGFHDATWQYWGFGGDLYRAYGSHGCINLPLEKAAELFEISNYEDPVVCFY